MKKIILILSLLVSNFAFGADLKYLNECDSLLRDSSEQLEITLHVTSSKISTVPAGRVQVNVYDSISNAEFSDLTELFDAQLNMTRTTVKVETVNYFDSIGAGIIMLKGSGLDIAERVNAFAQAASDEYAIEVTLSKFN